MSNSTNLMFGLDAEGAAKRLERAGKTLAKDLKAGGDSVHTLIIKAIEQGNKSSEAAFNKLAEEATRTIEEANAGVEEARRKLAEADAAHEDELEKLGKKANKAEREALKEKHRKDREQHEKNLKKAQEVANHQAAQASKRFEAMAAKDIARVEEHARILKEAQEKSSKLTRTRIQEGGEFVGERISGALSLGIDDLGKALTFSMVKAGSAASEMATKRMAKNAESGKESGGLVKALAAIGPVMAGMAAVVGGLAMVFGAAYSQVKDLNKAILEGSTALDIFGPSALDASFDLKAGLKTFRAAAFEISDLTGQSAESVIGMVKAFNTSGLSLNRLKGAFSDTGAAFEAYTNMAIFATRYSQAFGMSVDEIAQNFTSLFQSLGTGLTSIENGFSAIMSGAQVAGMNVKDFFTAVSQTTSGLALYNIRLEDTAKNLASLTKILGKEKAQEFIGREPELGGAGIEDRFKTGMLVGKRGQRVFQKSFDQQFASFTEEFGEDFAQVLGDVSQKSLSGMSGKDFGALQERLVALGDKTGKKDQAQAAARRLEAVRKVAQGAKGGAMNMAKGMSGLGPLQDVSMRLLKGMALTGTQNLDDMDFIARKHFEDMTGISGKNFDEMATLLNRYQALAPEKSVGEVLELMASGQLPMSEGDKKLFEELSKTKPESMEALANKQIEAVTSVADILKNRIAGLLEGLSDIVTDIFDGLAEWISDFGDAKKKKVAREEARTGLKKDEETLKALNKEKAVLTQKLAEAATGTDPVLKRDLMDELNNVLVRITGVEAEAGVKRDIVTGLAEGKGLEEVTQAAWAKRAAGPAMQTLTTGGQSNAPKSVGRSEEEKAAILGSQLELETEQAVKDGKFQRDESKRGEKSVKTLGEIEKSLREQKALDLLTGAFGPDLVAKALSQDASLQHEFLTELRARPEYKGIAQKAGLPYQDFIYRGDGVRGTIQPISTRDEFFGAKPGGAIDKAINGTGSVVNIHIHGGNEAQVYNTVKRALKAAK